MQVPKVNLMISNLGGEQFSMLGALKSNTGITLICSDLPPSQYSPQTTSISASTLEAAAQRTRQLDAETAVYTIGSSTTTKI
jgi:hypothetical protein